ncbi:SCO2522 family protein [Actinocrispum sp. NPDC049592]|uniref:SCO2522 family protein n=1 Tax=Actinocrispum sp. NPDC049592 TaxID=3154835 RepID=UPI0034121F27
MTAFAETSAQTRTEREPLSHLSVELGQLSIVDLDPDRLRQLLDRAAVWARAASEVPVAQPRVSTCLLIDDYHRPGPGPAEVLPPLLAIAAEGEPRIDYLVRESGFAPLADLVAARLVAVPAPGTNGSLDPPEATGWVCNGRRSPGSTDSEAMYRTQWSPPEEIGARNHSVFVDVRLRDDESRWSRAFLTAVRHLVRLGLVRDGGKAVIRPRPLPPELPRTWAGLPPVTRLTRGAKPFTAYRTFSLLPARALQVENAARIILSQVSLTPELLGLIEGPATGEGIHIPPQLIDRVGYMLFAE